MYVYYLCSVSFFYLSFCGPVSRAAAVTRADDSLVYRVSHDTLGHRDATSVVRRASKAKTDCETASRRSALARFSSWRAAAAAKEPATLQTLGTAPTQTDIAALRFVNRPATPRRQGKRGNPEDDQTPSP